MNNAMRNNDDGTATIELPFVLYMNTPTRMIARRFHESSNANALQTATHPHHVTYMGMNQQGQRLYMESRFILPDRTTICGITQQSGMRYRLVEPVYNSAAGQYEASIEQSPIMWLSHEALGTMRYYGDAIDVHEADTRTTTFPAFIEDALARKFVRTCDYGRAIGDNIQLYVTTAGEGYLSETRYQERQAHLDAMPENYRERYHSGSGNPSYLRFGLNSPQYLVGIEIEKEDYDVLRMVNLRDFYQLAPKWRKEADGSLDRDSGFELISPVMEFDPELIHEHIEQNDTLRHHVNARKSTRCGLHVNVSDTMRTPWEIFDDITGYLPVLCALYPMRANNTFCKAYDKGHMIRNNDKYQALHVKHDRVEIRIFPAVTTNENLRFRLRLVRFMLENPANHPRHVNREKLAAVLSEIHTNETHRQKFAERLEDFTQRLRMF